MLPTEFNGVSISIQENNLVNLTDIWKAAGAENGKEVWRWMNDAGNADFILALANKLKPHLAGGLTEKPFGRENKKELAKWTQEVFKCATAGGLIKTTRGKGGGTWAHWQIALAYAKYLSPELHMFVNQVFKERMEEEVNPELAYSRGRERAVKGWKRRGKSDDWIANRLKGIEQRKVFTSTLSRHGVTGSGYATCTNNVQEPILGKTTHLAKQERGLKSKDNLRDHLGNIETIGITLAEALAKENIELRNYQGNSQCATACLDAGSKIARAIKEARAIVNG